MKIIKEYLNLFRPKLRKDSNYYRIVEKFRCHQQNSLEKLLYAVFRNQSGMKVEMTYYCA